MNTIFREVKTRLRLTVNPNINFPAHIHDDLELVYVLRGGGYAYCDGQKYPLSQGQLFLAFPNQIHSYAGCDDGEYALLIVKPSRLLYLTEIFRQTLPVSPVCNGSPVLQRLLEDVLEEFRTHGDSYTVDGYLTAFFGKLFQSLPLERSTVPSGILPQLLQFCNQHYTEAICLQDLCDHLHISRSYASHLFSNALGMHFPDYINTLRLNKAVSLLENPALNITQVAEAAGFPTIRTFNRIFQKQFGCSPSVYRKRQK